MCIRDRATVVLFTDIWLSPVAGFADLTISAPTDTQSPFDTLVTPLMQVEAMVAGAAARLGADWRERVMVLEAVRSENRITLGQEPASPDPKEKP